MGLLFPNGNRRGIYIRTYIYISMDEIYFGSCVRMVTNRKLKRGNPTQSFSSVKNMFAPKWLVLNIWYVRSYTAIEAKVSFCHNGYSIFNDIHNCFYSLAGFQWEFSILTFNNYNYTYVCIFFDTATLILLASRLSSAQVVEATYILLQKY